MPIPSPRLPQYFERLGSSREFGELSAKLSTFGMTANESKLYLYLLSKKESITARTASAELGMHRVDTYRTLRALANAGLIETRITSPKKFSATSPSLAMTTLLKRSQNQLEHLKDVSESLAPELNSFQRANAGSSITSHIAKEEGASYRVVSNREAYYSEIKALIRGANNEVLRILSALGLKLSKQLDYDKEYRLAVNRGVRIRIIAEVNNDNLIQARNLSKLVELRHLANINARFTVVDRKTTVIGHKFERTTETNTLEENYLVLDDPQFAEVSHFFFDHLWTLARQPKL